MGGVSPETCWAIKKHWNNKFYYTVASCWFFLWVLYYAAWLHEHQEHQINVHNKFYFSFLRQIHQKASFGMSVILQWLQRDLMSHNRVTTCDGQQVLGELSRN
jgi:hypothetical protein